MLVAQNSLGPVCPVPLTVRGIAQLQAQGRHGRISQEMLGMEGALGIVVQRRDVLVEARDAPERRTLRHEELVVLNTAQWPRVSGAVEQHSLQRSTFDRSQRCRAGSYATVAAGTASKLKEWLLQAEMVRPG